MAKKMSDMAYDAIERKAEKEKQKLKKKARKAFRRTVRSFFRTLFALGLGIFIGMHWRVILAYVTGGELPEAPEAHKGHCLKDMIRRR